MTTFNFRPGRPREYAGKSDEPTTMHIKFADGSVYRTHDFIPDKEVVAALRVARKKGGGARTAIALLERRGHSFREVRAGHTGTLRQRMASRRAELDRLERDLAGKSAAGSTRQRIAAKRREIAEIDDDLWRKTRPAHSIEAHRPRWRGTIQ
jgi:hypothetical protein